MKLTHLILLAVLIAAACNTSKTNVSGKNISNTLSSMSDTTAITSLDTLPLIVQFYSIGEGVNSESKIAMDVFIKHQEKKYNTTISYQSVAWGREGEFDCCFRLSNLSLENKASFIGELKNQFNDKSLVHVYENQTCRHIRN